MALVGMLFEMHLAHNIFINSMVMAYIYVETCPILAMIYTPFEMHMTLVMTYIPIKTCLTPTMALCHFPNMCDHDYDLHFHQDTPNFNYVLHSYKNLFGLLCSCWNFGYDLNSH
jgi:hypothetical protein